MSVALLVGAGVTLCFRVRFRKLLGLELESTLGSGLGRECSRSSLLALMNVKGGVSVRGNNIKKYRNGPTGHVQNYRCKTNRVYVTTVSRSLLGRGCIESC